LASLDGQNGTKREDRLAAFLGVAPLRTLRLIDWLNSTLLALDVFLVLCCKLILRHGFIALIDLHVAVRARRGKLLPLGRLDLRVVTAAGEVCSRTTVVLVILRAGLVVGPTVAIVVLERDLLVACPRWGRRCTTDGAAAEVLRVGISAHYGVVLVRYGDTACQC
jgi:hypothetical protein